MPRAILTMDPPPKNSEKVFQISISTEKPNKLKISRERHPFIYSWPITCPAGTALLTIAIDKGFTPRDYNGFVDVD